METILHLVLLVGLCSQSAQLFFIQTSGRLESDHTLFYVGENATLHCRKDSGTIAAGLVFKIGGQPVDDKYVTRVSNSHARLDKPVTGDDLAESEYACRDPSEIGSKVIYTDYAPQNATSFTMVWLHKSHLIVTWKHGVGGNTTYKNIHTNKVIRITSEWRRVRNDSSGGWQSCNNSSSTYCKIPDVYNRDDIFAIRVSVTNVKRSDTKATIFTGRKVFHYAKPSPPTLETIEVLGKTSVKLTVMSSWSKVIRRITYCRTGVENNPCSEVDIPVGSQTQPGEDITLRTMVINLHPSYTFTLQVQDKFEKGGYFSDPSNSKSVTMPEDVPAAGPEVTPGGFYWDSPDCSKTPSAATVYIYFQEVPEDQRNGRPTKYSGEIISPPAGKGQTFHTNADSAHTLKVDRADCGKGFEASLYLSNKEGRSPASVLNVPPWDQALHDKIKNLDLKLRVVDGNITAEWNLDPDLEDHTFLLYHCPRDDAYPNQCQDPVRYVTLSPTEGSVAVPAEALNMVGLAVVSPQGTTIGIVKSNCIYNPKSVRKPISGLRAIPQEGGFVVSWPTERCDPNTRVLIQQYEIELCLQASSAAGCQSHKIAGEKNSWTTTALEAGSNYSIRIRYQTDGGWSVFSEPRMVRVPEGGKGLESGQVVGIVMGVLLVCIILGVLVFCYCRDKIKQLKGLFSPNIKSTNFRPDTSGQNNDIIDVDNESAIVDDDNKKVVDSTKINPPLITQQISDDSGYDPNSPPQSPFPDGPATSPGLAAGHLSADPAKPSPTPATGEEGSAGMSSLTSSKVAFCDSSLSRDKSDVADSASRKEDGSMPPYVSAAVMSSAGSYSGTDPDRVPLTQAEHSQWMVYHAARDPPRLGQGNGKRPGEGDVTLQEKKQAGKEGVVLDPSALEVVGASKGVSNYVRLSTPGSNDVSSPDEETARKSVVGEESDEDDEALVVDDDGLQDSVSESSSFSSGSPQDDAVRSMSVGYASGDRSAEEPPPQEKAETRLNPAYVAYPGQTQSSQTNVEAAGEDPQTWTEQTTDSQPPDQRQSGLHLAYVPLKLQPQQAQPALCLDEEEDNLSECSESEAEKPERASDHDRAGHAVGGEAPAISRPDYVPLPPLPGASLPLAGHHSPSTSAFTPGNEDSDADSMDSLPGDGTNREGQTTSWGGVLDGKGYVHLKLPGLTTPDTTDTAADRLAEKDCVRSEHSADGSTRGKGLPDSDHKAQTRPEDRRDRSGYVCFENVPNRSNPLTQGKELTESENRGQTSPGDKLDRNGYVRIENGTVGSTLEERLTNSDSRAQTRPESMLDKNGYVRFENIPDRSHVLDHGNALTGSDGRSQTGSDGYDLTDIQLRAEGTANHRVNSNGYVPRPKLPYQNDREAQC